MVAVDQFQANRVVFNERMMTFAVGVLALLYIAHDLKAGDTEGERTALAIVVVAGQNQSLP